jgi:hypothetical protein
MISDQINATIEEEKQMNDKSIKWVKLYSLLFIVAERSLIFGAKR